MDLNQLNQFRVVARLENVTKAAEELYISQPNLSTSIARLESNLGVKLFSREKGRIRLTENGKILLHHVNRVFQELDAAKSELLMAQEIQTEIVRVAANFAQILPEIYSKYTTDYGPVPNYQLVMHTDTILEELRDQSTDFAITIGEIGDEHVRWEPFFEEPTVAVLRGDHPAEIRGSCRLHDLRDAHFICNALFLPLEILNDMCSRAGFEPTVVRYSNEQESYSEESADFGDNVFLCPLHFVPHLLKESRMALRFVEIEDHFSAVSIGIAQNRSQILSRSAGEYRAFVEQELPPLLAKKCDEGREILRAGKQPV